MPSKKVLAERIKAEHSLRHYQERWHQERRQSELADRTRKAEELDAVRLQLQAQAALFATKEFVDAKVDTVAATLEGKFNTQITQLNTEGTNVSRESERERHGREEATKEILASSRATQEAAAVNRRWLIGIIVTVALGLLANGLALIYHVLG